MEMMIERRADGASRIPLQLPVALSPEDAAGSFEADAVNLGPGGLSMRAPLLPDVGSELVCRFDVPPGEVPMEVRGEVVWAHRAEDGFAHFGLRFVDMPGDRIALIAELLAEQANRVPRATVQRRDRLETPVEAPAPRTEDVDVERQGVRRQASRPASEAPTFRGGIQSDGQDASEDESPPGLRAREVDEVTANPWETEAQTEAQRPQGHDGTGALASTAGEQSGPRGEQQVGARDPDGSNEQVSCDLAAAPPDAALPEVAIELDIGATLEGELARQTDSQALFVQPLQMLAVGEGLWLNLPDGQRKRATISNVGLRLEQGLPRLALNVVFEGAEASFADLMWPEASDGSHARGADADLVPDTVPDLEPPMDRVLRERRTTVTEFGAPETPRLPDPASALEGEPDSFEAERSAASRPQTDAHTRATAVPDDGAGGSVAGGARSVTSHGEPGAERRVVDGNAAASASAHERTAAGASLNDASFIDGVYTDFGSEFEDELPPEGGASSAGAADAPSGRDDARELRLTLPTEDEVEDGHDERASAAPPALVAAVAAAGRWTERVSRVVAGQAGTLANVARAGLSAGRTHGRTLGRTVGTLVKPGPRRRTTGGRRRTAAAGKARGQNSVGLKPFLVGALAMGAVALGVYALAPSSEEAGLPVEVAAGTAEGSAAAVTAAPVAEAPAAAAPVAAAPAAAEPAAVPKPKSVPEDSPYAVDVNAPSKPRAAAPTGPAFGDVEVPNARRFTLRMTEKVKELKGVTDDSGFRVIIPGSLSLDRAGPIASAHGAVRRSMILNKGDHSELTIRFDGEEKPAYRVLGKGASLELLIAEP